jgi:hypothetical protein
LDGKSAIPLQHPQQAPKVKFLSTAENVAFDNEPAFYRVGRPICPHKIEFSFLNLNLMVPASHRLISIE